MKMNIKTELLTFIKKENYEGYLYLTNQQEQKQIMK